MADFGDSPVGDPASDAEKAALRSTIDVEKTAELDARDVANRKRKNQTGPLSDIAGLFPALNRRANAGGRRFETNGSATLAAGSQDFGTNDFALHGVIALDTYTPASAGELWSSHSAGNNRATLSILSNGDWRLSITDDGGAVTDYDFTPPVALTDGEAYAVTLTAAPGGDATLYIGVHPAVSVSIAASSGVDIGTGNSNAGKLFADASLSGTIRDYTPFTRLLTTAEKDAIHAKGIKHWFAEHPEDRWGGRPESQSVYEKWIGTGTITNATTTSFTVSSDADDMGARPSALTNNNDLRITKGQTFEVSITTSGGLTAARLTFRQPGGAGTVQSENIAMGTTVSTITALDDIGYMNFTKLDSDGTEGSVTINYIRVFGATASIPFDDGIGFQGRDNSTNHADGLASAAGVAHLLPQTAGQIRALNVDASGGAYLLAARDLLDPRTVITGVVIDGDYTAASGTQTETLRRIRVITSGSDVLVQRSDGTTHQTIATVTPASTSDFEITVLISRY